MPYSKPVARGFVPWGGADFDFDNPADRVII
jgi:hypothetical protein